MASLNDQAGPGLRSSDPWSRARQGDDGLAAAPGQGLTLAQDTGGNRGLSVPGVTAKEAGPDWQSIAAMASRAIKSGQAEPVPQESVAYRDPGRSRLGEELLQASSKRLKTKFHGDPVKRGLSGSDPIDRNGMTIKGIQELSARIVALSKRLAHLKKRKAA